MKNNKFGKAPAMGGMGGMGGANMQNLMKQAQKMQQDMLKAQEELETMEFSASSGGGAVKATVTGKKQLVKLEISPEVVDADDVEMLQDLIIAAVNEALKTCEDQSADKISSITGGMVPGGLL